ncbi:MAG: HAMP domain-containing sensor histidine kinase [Casimicrobiaceae bacterium]
MDKLQHSGEQLEALASHLAARREAVMLAWRQAIACDPEMNAGASLPRAQLNDHVPQLLEAFGAKLRALAGNSVEAPEDGHKDDGAAHGLQRWQQGYDLREVTREWGRLELCMADELERYAATRPGTEAEAMAIARRTWTEVCTDGVCESTSQYFHLREIEAAGHVRDLEAALEQMQAVEQQRAELWQQAAHDLRGNLGVVANASAVLSMQAVPEQSRDDFVRMLNRNVTSLYALLEDVTNLARLQAGQERRQVRSFDAAAILTELCAGMQPFAQERALYLKVEGPATLAVQGDDVKVRRIAQNLLLNALKYTERGGVTVSWDESRRDDINRWMLSVQDTGPGIHAGPGAPMANALEEATKEARQVDKAARSGAESGAAVEPVAPRPHDARLVHQERGEGIGLSIVKRLCELLDATMEMDSTAGKGSVVRILFPRSYA